MDMQELLHSMMDQASEVVSRIGAATNAVFMNAPLTSGSVDHKKKKDVKKKKDHQRSLSGKRKGRIEDHVLPLSLEKCEDIVDIVFHDINDDLLFPSSSKRLKV